MSATDPSGLPAGPAAAAGAADAADARRLLTLLAAHGGHHLEKVVSDLDQTESLLAEAIERLVANFHALADAAAQGRAALDTALASGDRAAAQASAAQLADALRTQVNAAVSNLQFHDLSSQLMTRARRRVDGVRDMLNACDAATGSSDAAGAASGAASGASAGSSGAAAEAAVLADSEKLDRDLHQGVRQRQMDSGDIELF